MEFIQYSFILDIYSLLFVVGFFFQHSASALLLIQIGVYVPRARAGKIEEIVSFGLIGCLLVQVFVSICCSFLDIQDYLNSELIGARHHSFTTGSREYE